MPTCPNCKTKMVKVEDGFTTECPNCGKRLTHAEGLKQHHAPQRRIIRIPIPERLVWQFCLEEPKDDPDVMLQFTIRNGLPHDAVFVGSTFDPCSLNLYLFFTHESFDPVQEGMEVPQRVLEYTERPVVQIPERHKAQILKELDALDWDRDGVEDSPGLWVMLNKLKHSLGGTLDYVTCKWSDLDTVDNNKLGGK